MKYAITLDKDDYLTFQLFTASTTKRVRNGRIRGWIYTTAIFMILAVIFYESNNAPVATYSLVLSVLSMAFYPFYSRWRYKRHYDKFVSDVFGKRFGEQSNIEISGDTILVSDPTGEARINVGAIEEINEIKSHFFLKTQNGESLILPKRDNGRSDNFADDINMLVSRGVKRNQYLDWRWK